MSLVSDPKDVSGLTIPLELIMLLTTKEKIKLVNLLNAEIMREKLAASLEESLSSLGPINAMQPKPHFTLEELNNAIVKFHEDNKQLIASKANEHMSASLLSSKHYPYIPEELECRYLVPGNIALMGKDVMPVIQSDGPDMDFINYLSSPEYLKKINPNSIFTEEEREEFRNKTKIIMEKLEDLLEEKSTGHKRIPITELQDPSYMDLTDDKVFLLERLLETRLTLDSLYYPFSGEHKKLDYNKDYFIKHLTPKSIEWFIKNIDETIPVLFLDIGFPNNAEVAYYIHIYKAKVSELEKAESMKDEKLHELMNMHVQFNPYFDTHGHVYYDPSMKIDNANMNDPYMDCLIDKLKSLRDKVPEDSDIHKFNFNSIRTNIYSDLFRYIAISTMAYIDEMIDSCYGYEQLIRRKLSKHYQINTKEDIINEIGENGILENDPTGKKKVIINEMKENIILGNIPGHFF